MSRMDKLCLAALILIWLGTGAASQMLDRPGPSAAQPADKPFSVTLSLPIDCTSLVEAVERRREEAWRQSVPLDGECLAALEESCAEYGVPVSLVLGVIEVESNFQAGADNGVSAGLMQLNKRYYPAELAPAENIRAGVAHLAGQIKRYGGDIPAALRAYNRGYDDGDRQYAKTVMDAQEKWGKGNVDVRKYA